MLTLLAGLALAVTPVDPGPALIGGGHLPDAREFAVMRPSRGAHAGAVASAARVPARWRPFAACVADRESHGNPAALNPSSGAAGIFQFLPAWRHGLPYNVAARLRDHGLPHPAARQVRHALSDRPIHQWPAAYQWVAFADQVTRPGGWEHWSLPGSRCEGLVP